MPDNRALDGLEFSSLDLPYNRVLRELDDEPRIVEGINTYVTYGGKLVKRPGTIKVSDTVDTSLSKRLDRLWVYETLDGYIYLLASAFDTGTHTWGLYYIRADQVGSPVWTSAGTLRDINVSTRAHEMTVSRGLAFIKGYPDSGSTEKLGTVIFDGTGGSITLRFWGLIGPTEPAHIEATLHKLAASITASGTTVTVDSSVLLPSVPFNIQIDYEVMTVTAMVVNTLTVLRAAQGTVASAHYTGALVVYRSWTASTHPVVVNMDWGYTYAYKTSTGHISNRAPLETDPDDQPSLTGPFLNLIPKITVQGHTDTTNVPKIKIYRTTDGGGTFYELDEIDNTGTEIVYEDNTRTSSTGDHDPIADADLDIQSVAGDLNSNSPPPTVLAPSITGTDTPIKSTPIAAYQGRLWFALGNVLFYSANEELNTGIPEEAWPTGLNGNFFRFQHPIVNVAGTSDSLYVLTTESVYEISGSTRETFNVRLILNNIGAAIGHPRALCKYGDAIVWLTNDLRIAILQGSNFRTISEPLGEDLVDLISNNDAEVDIQYWAELDKEWLVTTAICSDMTDNRTFVYDVHKSSDLKKDFWNTPWTIPASAAVSGRLSAFYQQRRLMFFSWTGSSGYLTRITTLADEITGTDAIPGEDTTPYDFRFKTNLFMTVTGDHINVMRRPGLVPVVYNFILERTLFAGDGDPDVYYYTNDLWSAPKPTRLSETPARDDEPTGYKTLIYSLQEKAKRIALHVEKLNSTERFELQNLAILWNPDAGAGV